MAYDERMLLYDNIPVTCKACGGRLEPFGQGTYKCAKCGELTYDDFGKVKRFLDENGPSPAVVISRNTGVPVTRITQLIREGRIEAQGMRQ